ncbi:MAG: GntR family transcriptional regulator [Rhodospirillum sp.]|nr:GntR family transcriptional regulator [Rhodospirillum sp.]MCF8489568.1 GntR family transcriptional regulator [Rhodospirillum sp.]MCF8501600.1 GntR family transcriptional regulator [Rhodospirillum sp.]
MSTLTIPEIEMPEGATTQEYAYERLRNAIMVGAIEPGTALTIRSLAETLALSLTPIREAVRRLSSESAIEVLGNRRLRVPDMTPGRFDELVRLRVVLETYAAQRSLPFVSDRLVDDMVALDERMDASYAAGEFNELTHLNRRFHGLLYCLNPDQAVMPLIESIWLQLGPFQRQVVRHLGGVYVVDHHKKLIEAVRIRDPEAVAAAIEGDVTDGLVRSGRALLKQDKRVVRVA